MRRLLSVSALTALALGATVATANAQNKTMGIVAGVDFATINGNDYQSGAGSRTGFQGGLFIAIPLGAAGWMFEPEALYSMQGATYSSSGFDQTLAADYIKIPFLVKWSKNPGGKGIYVMAGPTRGFNVSCNISGTDPLAPSMDPARTRETSRRRPPSAVTSALASATAGSASKGATAGIGGMPSRSQHGQLGDGTSLNMKNNVWSILLRFIK